MNIGKNWYITLAASVLGTGCAGSQDVTQVEVDRVHSVAEPARPLVSSSVTMQPLANPASSPSVSPEPAASTPVPSDSSTMPNMVKQGTNLDRWLSYQNLSRSQIMARIGADGRHIRRGVKRRKLTELEEIHREENEPAYFYFREGMMVLLLLSEPEVLGRFRASTLYPQFGGPGIELPSGACRHCILHVYPNLGVSFSTDEGDTIDYVEIFPPTTIDAYKRDIYVEPLPWGH